MEHSQTIREIYAQMDRMGDLPVFSASVNRIRLISTNPDSNAMDLAQEVMKDTNLSVKLLRLANSTHYNRGLGKIGSISRAVILLGFNMVKNLGFTLKFIESFQQDYPGIDMGKILVRCYLTAGFVRNVAIKCGVKDAEESYICALLHNLGEVACAYFLPEKYIEILRLKKTQTLRAGEAEQAVLGMSFMSIGKTLATNWGFPSAVTSTLADYLPNREGPIRSSGQLNRALSSLASRVVDQLYVEHAPSEVAFQHLLGELAKAAGTDVGVIEERLSASFRMSCDLAGEYGLNRKMLQPLMREDEDESRDRIARTFAYYAANQNPVPDSTITTLATPQDTERPFARHSSNPMLQLEIIQQITGLITHSASLSTIFLKVLEGIHLGVGFERAVLCLLSTDRTSYAGRLALGEGAEDLKRYFCLPINTTCDLLSKVLMEGNELVVENVLDASWHGLIRDDFFAHTKASSFMLSSLHHRDKPVGLFYADKAVSNSPMTAEERRGFSQFVAQAELALLHINK